MSTIIPHSESVKRAFAFITEERAMHPKQPLASLLDAAGCRFNLSPLDSEALERLLSERSSSILPGEGTQDR